MTVRQRRSFSQANLGVRYEGPLGEMLAEALQVPQESGYTGTHAFHPYPGRFHPALARTILDAAVDPGGRVFDPFMGGGTTMVEAMLTRRPSVGCDLNPVAVLVARERTRSRTYAQAERVMEKVNSIAGEVVELRKAKSQPRVDHPHVKQLASQYQPHLIAEMLQWIRLINGIHDSSVRETARAVFSAGSVKFSNRRADSAGQDAPPSFPKGAVSRFMTEKCDELTKAQIKLIVALQPHPPERPVLRQEDARLLPSFEWGEFDTILTSPPYPGTYDYLDHHRLRMAWLELDEEPLRCGEIGARRDEGENTWSADNRDVMVALARVLKPGGSLFLVVGDWMEGGHAVDGGVQISRLAADKGWRLVSNAAVEREIHSHKEKRAYRRRGKWEHLLHMTR